MANDWLDKAKHKAQEAASAAMNAGANLKTAAEQISHSVKSSAESFQHHSTDSDIPELLAKAEHLLHDNLEKITAAVELLAAIKTQLANAPIAQSIALPEDQKVEPIAVAQAAPKVEPVVATPVQNVELAAAPVAANPEPTAAATTSKKE
jgi:hypothetical protein